MPLYLREKQHGVPLAICPTALDVPCMGVPPVAPEGFAEPQGQGPEWQRKKVPVAPCAIRPRAVLVAVVWPVVGFVLSGCAAVAVGGRANHRCFLLPVA